MRAYKGKRANGTTWPSAGFLNALRPSLTILGIFHSVDYEISTGSAQAVCITSTYHSILITYKNFEPLVHPLSKSPL